MAVPKKRKSQAKTRSRRAQHDKIVAVKLQRCAQCYAFKRSHRACPECGVYGASAEQVVEVQEY